MPRLRGLVSPSLATKSRDLTTRAWRLHQPYWRGMATAASPELYDVVCVGGGPAGLSLLASLREHLVSGTPKPEADVCKDPPRNWLIYGWPL